MHRSQFEHIIRASAEVTKEQEFIVIGSQAILGKVPDAPKVLRQSIELDVYPKNRPELANDIDGSLGELSSFHRQFGVYAHGIGPETATLAKDWQVRLIPVSNEGTNGATAWCLEPHDIAYSKLAAGREKDINYVLELRKHKLISPSKIQKLIDGTENEELRSRLEGLWQRIQTKYTALNRKETPPKRRK